MGISIEPWRQALAPETVDFADDAKWPTDTLRLHIGQMLAEQEFANARHADELQHRISQGIGELILRGHMEPPQQQPA